MSSPAGHIPGRLIRAARTPGSGWRIKKIKRIESTANCGSNNPGLLRGRGALLSGRRPRPLDFGLVPQLIVEPAEHPAVRLGGGPAEGVGLDVVGLTDVCRSVAVRVGALAVPELEASSGGSGEESGRLADLDPVGRFVDRPFEVGPLQPGKQAPRGEGDPLGQLTGPSTEGGRIQGVTATAR